MGIAGRLRALRVRAGQSQAQMAQRLGLNVAWYADLEICDDELTATLTLFQAMELASLLGVTLPDLFGVPPDAIERIALIDLPQCVQACARRKAISIGQMEERMGWALQDLLASPLPAVAALPLQFLQDLAAELEINWIALIPDAHSD